MPGRRRNGPQSRDLTGQPFGRLVVIERVYQPGPAYWRCTCECGATKVAAGKHLRGRRTKSCGCLVQENARAMAAKSNAKARAAAYLKRASKPKPTQRDLNRDRAKGEVSAGSSGKFHADERAAIEAFEAAGKVTVIVGPFPDLNRPELWPRGTIRSRQRGNINSRVT